MTDQQVAATLRAATATGLIVSWIDLPNGEWTINTQLNGARNKTPLEIRAYCRMLNHAGINPTTC